MLSFSMSGPGLSRRSFLNVGTLALGGLSLPWLLETRAAAAKPVATDKSVIFLFQHGGPTQIETFDPKMTAPEGIRSVTGEIATSIPGVTFGSTMAKLAPLAHKFSVVRSFTTGEGDHDIRPILCKETMMANLGSIFSRVAGLNHPRTGIPNNTAIFPEAVEPQPGQNILGAYGRFLATGAIGPAFAPFVPGLSSNLLRDMQVRLNPALLNDRRALLSQFDTLRRDIDTSGAAEAWTRMQQQAFDVIAKGVAHAFDLSKEDAATLARYDTAPLVTFNSLPKDYNFRFFAHSMRALGKQLLLARRLCEHGCGFVTVTTNMGWDMHGEGNAALPVKEGMPLVAGPFDHAVAAFIQDLEARGLSDRIMLVACGEMGRTPRVNPKGGRDHWGKLAPLLVYGGGLRMGQVIGRSTSNAGEPATEPYHIRNLLCTIMHTLFDVGEIRTRRDLPVELIRFVTEGEPIRELLPSR